MAKEGEDVDGEFDPLEVSRRSIHRVNNISYV